ncbi:uncharacterized protein B0H18DRAFT_1034842 [Fomitopsis serialis]|uniref:uncharacterized protein n=1 Tax=Fomitopsis serialis TaxID=139415 RepID=UPI0020074A04|nr:uncharacterized protein B0H18DRAFT_1034842 [Neoantrodia serialis]KAH9917304.1 hypothetical protein B0H18DRAFT_1034842 [Neoantrodia serialis]
MSKHAFEIPSPSSTPPSKRTRFDPDTSSPVRRHTTRVPTSASDSSPYTHYSFPSSGTSTSTPYSIPADSPTNPFGLQRTLLALKLPRPLGFAQHLALRFQLVYDPPRRDTKGKGKARAGQQDDVGKEDEPARVLAAELENVHRIVQVPTNYTFRHLHKLVLWLLASDARWKRPPGATLPSRYRRSPRLKEQKTQPVAGHRRARSAYDRKGKGRMVEEDPDEGPRPAIGTDVPSSWAGHVFEVRDNVQLYTHHYRPGVIKRGSGRVLVRLSSVRDRKLFPDLYGDNALVKACSSSGYASSAASTSGAWSEGGELDATSSPETDFEEDADDLSADEWVWEAEDDYTIEHVWPDGLDYAQAIIYHHLPGCHKLPPRKGAGNQPFVFRWKGSACGAVRIAHLSPPSSAFRLSNEVFEDETDTDEHRLHRWNYPNAFPRFLAQEEERERALRRQRTASLPSGLSDAGLSSPPYVRLDREDTDADVRSPLPPSSPPRYSSSPARPGTALSSPSLAFPSIASPSTSPTRPRTSPGVSTRARARTLSYPFSSPGLGSTLGALPLTTPFPAHPLLAKRVRRASNRLTRITRDGLDDMGSSEEEGKKKRKRPKRLENEEGGEVLVADSDVGEDAAGDEQAVDDEEFDGDALFAEDGSDDGEVGDLQSDGFWREMGGFGTGYTQWIGEGKEEDWDPFGEAEV